MLVPLHHPVHLAKETATLQELSGGRFLRSASAWAGTRDEYESWACLSRAAGGAATRRSGVMQALWSGERDYEGELLVVQRRDRGAAPVAGAGDLGRRQLGARDPARARARRRVASVARLDVDHVREVKERYPELRVVPRTRPELVDEMLDAGAEGAVVTFPDEAAMRDFARRYVE